MRALGIGCVVAAALSVGGCGGGGGGGVGSASSTPANTNIASLQSSQTFSGNGASTATAFDLATRTVKTGSSTAAAVQISYDAAARSYTVTVAGRSQSFLPADLQSSASGETKYQKSIATGTDYLTIATTPYSSTTANRYVALGYWQRNETANGVQSTQFDTFTFGLETAAGAVPRSGTASYVTDNFGLVTVPGRAPTSFNGSGLFTVDFGAGVFGTSAYVTETEITTGRTASGGSIRLIAQGRLGSDNGFTGNANYSGSYANVSGTIAGRFYGPAGEEIGASFTATDGAGAAVSGSLTGQASGKAATVNLTLTNLVTEQLFYSQQSLLSYGLQIGQFTLRPDGSATFSPGISSYAGATFLASDQVVGAANYVTYRKVVNGTTTTLALFKPGAANTELALTYAGFGGWQGGASPGSTPFDGRIFFTYGIATPTDLLTRRTGTATYAGITRGVGRDSADTTYDIGGTSRFQVDFDAQRFAGSLQMTATPAGGGSTADLGSWTFADRLAGGQTIRTGLIAPASVSGGTGSIVPVLYGPDGEEVAASFWAQMAAQRAGGVLTIVGAAAAKRQ